MKYELWHSPSEQSAVLLHEDDRASAALKAADARVIWSVEAESYQEALEQRDAFLEIAANSRHAIVNKHTPTTRFTIAVYVDQHGEQRTLAVPGWVGMVEAVIDANIDAQVVLGQMYFERPGLNAPLDMDEFLGRLPTAGVQHLTVVDLRSTNGQERMCQEFYGRMEDAARIQYLVADRLGPELPNWAIVGAHVLKARE